MQIPTQFLSAIGHTDRVFIRGLAPKLTPIPELESRGMTWQTKDGDIKKSVIEGYIDLKSGVFNHKYGNDYKSVTDGWGHVQSINKQGYGVYFVVGHGGFKSPEITHGTTLFHGRSSGGSKEDTKLIEWGRWKRPCQN